VDVCSNVTMFFSLFVSLINRCIDDHNTKQNQSFDEILLCIFQIQYGHAINQYPNKECTKYDIAYAALSTAQPNATEHHDQDNVVQQC